MISNTKNEFGYKKLIAWEIADKFAWKIYEATTKFPKEEIYGITSQLRRATLSVVLNIIEGYARYNKNEFRNFLRISLGSLAESGYLVEFAFRREYISDNYFKELNELKIKCGQLLWKLMLSQK